MNASNEIQWLDLILIFISQEKLISMFGYVFDIHPSIFLMDATAPGSNAVRALKQFFVDAKSKVLQVILSRNAGLPYFERR